MKIYTVTGSSSTKPVDLPDGFTVEETVREFSRTVGAYHDGDAANVRVEESDAGNLLLEFSSGNGYYFKRGQIVKLRDVLNEWLDEPVEITLDSPEPDRSRKYVDAQGMVWSYGVARNGHVGWHFNHSAYAWGIDELERDWFPWRVKD